MSFDEFDLQYGFQLHSWPDFLGALPDPKRDSFFGSKGDSSPTNYYRFKSKCKFGCKFGSSEVRIRVQNWKLFEVQTLGRLEVSTGSSLEHDLLSNKSQCLCTNGVYKQALFYDKIAFEHKKLYTRRSLEECLLKKILIENSSSRFYWVEDLARRLSLEILAEKFSVRTLVERTLVELEIPLWKFSKALLVRLELDLKFRPCVRVRTRRNRISLIGNFFYRLLKLCSSNVVQHYLTMSDAWAAFKSGKAREFHGINSTMDFSTVLPRIPALTNRKAFGVRLLQFLWPFMNGSAGEYPVDTLRISAKNHRSAGLSEAIPPNSITGHSDTLSGSLNFLWNASKGQPALS